MPAFDQVWKSITGKPAGPLTRYRFVNFDASGNVAHPTVAGGNAVGVAYEPNTVGQPAQIVASGFAFIELGATLAPGAAVMTDTTGRAAAYAVGTAPAYNVRLGTLASGGVLGDIGTILLN